MFPGSPDCPVEVYKAFSQRRPTDCQQDSRFYPQPVKAVNLSASKILFTSQPMGENTIGNIGKKMSEQANLQCQRKTNHSPRKMAIETLLHSKIEPTSVIQLTGHTNIQSLNSYAVLSTNQQQHMSNILSCHIESSPLEAAPVPTATVTIIKSDS